MRLISSAILASTLILGTAGFASAQSADALTTAAKDAAQDKAKDMVQDKAKDMLGDKASAVIQKSAPASGLGAIVSGVTGGEAATDASSLTSTSLSGSETMTAGKILLKGGSKTDVAKAIVKSRVEGMMDGKAEGLMGSAKAPALPTLGTGDLTSTGLSSSETMTAGKVLLNGGSKTDAVMAVGKSRVETGAKDMLSDKAESLISGATSPAPSTTETVTSMAPTNCPSGTTPQDNGTCMLTD